MSDTNTAHREPKPQRRRLILALENVSKYFGKVIALSGVTLRLKRGEVHCLLGDNGAGKSTLIKTLAGVHQPSSGQYLVDGKPVLFESPKDALDLGIATVYQDLALVPLLSVARNFFMGREPQKKLFGFLNVMDLETSATTARDKLAEMGINVRDPHQPIGTMSGGEKQCLAIARAIHFGARVLILDEPTAALGVKQSFNVLKLIHTARAQRHLGDLHHAQRAPRVSDRRFVHAAQSRQIARHVHEGHHQQGRSARHDGRRRRDAEDDRRTRRRDDLIRFARVVRRMLRRPHALSYSGIFMDHSSTSSGTAPPRPLRRASSRFAPGRSRDIVCLGRLAVDLYAQQVGARLEDVSSFAKYLGGSSANIAFGCARLGLASAMLARVGNDHMGRFLTETLTKEGCDVSHVRVDQRPPDRAGAARPERPRHLPADLLSRELRGHGGRRSGFRRGVHCVVESAADHRHALLDRAGEPHEPPRAGLRAPQPGAHGARHRLPPGAVGTHGQGGWRNALRRERRRHRASAAHSAAVRSGDRHRRGIPHRRRQDRTGRRARDGARRDAGHAGAQARAAGLPDHRRRGARIARRRADSRRRAKSKC